MKMNMNMNMNMRAERMWKTRRRTILGKGCSTVARHINLVSRFRFKVFAG
jgi:hypothetical protein